jgi:hypothetical protein
MALVHFEVFLINAVHCSKGIPQKDYKFGVIIPIPILITEACLKSHHIDQAWPKYPFFFTLTL